MKELVTDQTLSGDLIWYPYRKFLVVDGSRQRLRDEPASANTWWNVQVSFMKIFGTLLKSR